MNIMEINEIAQKSQITYLGPGNNDTGQGQGEG